MLNLKVLHNLTYCVFDYWLLRGITDTFPNEWSLWKPEQANGCIAKEGGQMKRYIWQVSLFLKIAIKLPSRHWHGLRIVKWWSVGLFIYLVVRHWSFHPMSSSPTQWSKASVPPSAKRLMIWRGLQEQLPIMVLHPGIRNSIINISFDLRLWFHTISHDYLPVLSDLV